MTERELTLGEPAAGAPEIIGEATVAGAPETIGEATVAGEPTVVGEAVPPPPVTSLDGTAQLAPEPPAAAPVAVAVGAEEGSDDVPVVVLPRRSRKRHRVRTAPWRTILVALAALLVLVALPVLGWKAANTIANSREGKAVAGAVPTGRLPSTPASLLVGLDAAGRPASLTVLSVAADGRGGTALVVPLGTAAYLNGLAKPERVDSAFAQGGLEAQTRGVESVLGISTTTSLAADEDQLTELLEPYTPVQVTFETPVLETASNGSTREVLSAGEHRLTARLAAKALLARVDGESELARLPRQEAVWAALLDRPAPSGGSAATTAAVPSTVATSDAADPGAPADLAGYLQAVTSGPVGVHALRVQPSFDPSEPSAPELLNADVGYLRLLVATVMPGAVSPSNGNLSFRIVNPLGDQKAVYEAVARLAVVQANVVLVTDVPGPAPEHTTIVYQSPLGETQSATFAPVLGAGPPVASTERIDGVDATVTLGQDFPAFLAAEAAKVAATSTTTAPTTTQPEATSTTTKRAGSTTRTTIKKGKG